MNRLQVYHLAVERGPDRQTPIAPGICSSPNCSLSQLDATIHVPSCCSWSCYTVGVTLKMLFVSLFRDLKVLRGQGRKATGMWAQTTAAPAKPSSHQGKARHTQRHYQVSTKPVTYCQSQICIYWFQSGRDDGVFSTSSCNICFWSIKPKQNLKS